MKKYCLPLIFLFLFFSSSAQDNSRLTQDQLSATFFLPGLEYESSLSNNTTWSLRLGTGFAASGGMSRENQFGIYLNLRGQYRYFYNLQKRLEKEKKISNNSGNYLALHTAFSSGRPIIGELQSDPDISGQLGPVWGMQRVYNSGFKLNLFLGAGYVFNDIGGSGIAPIFGFSLGWLILD